MAAAGAVPVAVLRRIVKELKSDSEPLGLSKAAEALGGPSKAWWSIETGLDGADYSSFAVEIEGPETYDSVLLDGAPRPSPYRKCWFKFQLDVSPTYPHDAPTVKLLTPTYHTHVASDGLKMCATYIPETWASVDAEKRSLYQLLVILRSFLAAPSGEHAVNSEASRQFQEDIDAFDAMARRKAGADDEDADGEDDDDDDDDDA
ncbi:hypothetical protein FNF29_07905 [Cafeteria roenbergensis]|nr:hypothetical protein FNF29_07905 [Cafeteria roenbergensis]KAA0160567.1 hypothetical protein FNF31_04276 [Cafeteria roenbergensis]KAA0163691.1 hypothetical protein FNF28_04168 [Cafeteria roenbergensis]|eukprot:KAA0146663.1 hypothetical protein FNF29_07905 [Cafeteria roenbergensis]